MEIKVYPFSFMEYLTYYEITDGYDDAFDQYVRTGGMPGAYVYKTEDRQYDYVRDVYSTILVRDLVEKYKIRNKSEFTNISEFMMDNIGIHHSVMQSMVHETWILEEFMRILFIWSYAEEDMRYMLANSIKEKWTLWLRNVRHKYIFR